jgi:hypothetical protein
MVGSDGYQVYECDDPVILDVKSAMSDISSPEKMM